MGYKSLESCVTDLEKNGQLIRIKREVDPYLEMASIQLRAYEKGAAAILFENVKGSKFRALSNLFGDVDRSRFLFRDSMEMVQNIALLKKESGSFSLEQKKDLYTNVSLSFISLSALSRMGLLGLTKSFLL